MKSRSSCLILIAAAILMTNLAEATLTDVDKTNILDYHRQVRVSAFGNVPEATMTWDDKLSKVAENWANRCQWSHNAGRTIDYAAQGGSGYVGENIAFYTTPSPFTPLDMVKSWANEKKDFTYPTTCSSGKVCGHYTQMIWKSTSRVGCAQANCPSLSGIPYGNTRFVVCDYAPGGNYVGKAPY